MTISVRNDRAFRVRDQRVQRALLWALERALKLLERTPSRDEQKASYLRGMKATLEGLLRDRAPRGRPKEKS